MSRSTLRIWPIIAVALWSTGGCAIADGTDTPDEGTALRRAFPEQAAEVLVGVTPFIEQDSGFALAQPEAARWSSLEITLPKRSSDAIRVRESGGFEVRVREVGAQGPATRAENAVAYARAGGTSFWTVAAGGVEEWLRLEAGVARAGEVLAAWEIDGGTPRQAGDVVVIVDAEGMPKIHVAAPRAFAAGGRPITPRLAVNGARIELFADGDGEEVLVDPSWTAAASMAAGRYYHSATMLGNGKVLVTGGRAGSASLSSAELYDPATNTWSAAASLAVARYFHTANLLGNGKVLVAGGAAGASFLASAELYDPSTNTWSTVGSLATGRYGDTATLLGNGKVLKAGGNASGGTVTSAELFDPATNTWSAAAAMATKRAYGMATLLADGRVLMVGGSNPSSITTCELYDPATDTWSAAGSMVTKRQGATVDLLANGKVLVAGGFTSQAYVAGAELYDPATNAWSAAASMSTARSGHTSTRLNGGKILVAGGHSGAAFLASSELYDPATDTWSGAGSMSAGRYLPASALLGNGQVLTTGGLNGSTSLASADLFTPDPSTSPNGTACSTGSQCTSGFCADGVCCDTACNGGACDACSVAAGAPSDGTCAPLTGNACDDGHACTTGDVCQAGVCTSGAVVTAGACTPVCITIQRTGASGSVQESTIATDLPAKNWGASASLATGLIRTGTSYGMIAFDLGAIPAGAHVTSAAATLNVYAFGGPSVDAHVVTVPWNEATVSWSGIGAGGFQAAVAATFPGATGQPSFPQVISPTSADLTALVQAWYDGSLPNHGIALEEASGQTSYCSSEWATAAQRPKLEVCYIASF